MHGKSFANGIPPYKPEERFLDSNNVAKILPVIKFVPAEKFQPYNEQRTVKLFPKEHSLFRHTNSISA